MGIIQSGILSPVSGKVSGVVGGRWKDKAYLRGYVKPANPNTAAQQTQRTTFSDVVSFCKPLVGQVFNSYTDKFQKSMSGFNFFIKRMIDIFDGSPDYSAILLTEGVLSTPSNFVATYSATSVVMTFTENLGNNGLGSDAIFAAVYRTSVGLWYFASAEVDRDTETITITVPSGMSSNTLECYLWAAQSVTGVLKSISNSRYIQAIDP